MLESLLPALREKNLILGNVSTHNLCNKYSLYWAEQLKTHYILDIFVSFYSIFASIVSNPPIKRQIPIRFITVITKLIDVIHTKDFSLLDNLLMAIELFTITESALFMVPTGQPPLLIYL